MKKLIILTFLHEYVQIAHYFSLTPILIDNWPNRRERSIIIAFLILAPPLYYAVNKYKNEAAFQRLTTWAILIINWVSVMILLALVLKKPWIFIDMPRDPHGDFSVVETWINPAIYYFFNLFFFLLFALLIIYKKSAKWNYLVLFNIIPFIIWIFLMIILSNVERPEFNG